MRETFFDKYPEYPSAYDEELSPNFRRFSVPSSTKAWRFCSLYGKKIDQYTKLDVLLEKKNSTMQAALQILRAGSLWKSSLMYYNFARLVAGRPYLPRWARFPVLKHYRSYLRISEQYRKDFCRFRPDYCRVIVMDCVYWYIDKIWAFSWTVNFIA